MQSYSILMFVMLLHFYSTFTADCTLSLVQLSSCWFISASRCNVAFVRLNALCWQAWKQCGAVECWFSGMHCISTVVQWTLECCCFKLYPKWVHYLFFILLYIMELFQFYFVSSFTCMWVRSYSCSVLSAMWLISILVLNCLPCEWDLISALCCLPCEWDLISALCCLLCEWDLIPALYYLPCLCDLFLLCIVCHVSEILFLLYTVSNVNVIFCLHCPPYSVVCELVKLVWVGESVLQCSVCMVICKCVMCVL